MRFMNNLWQVPQHDSANLSCKDITQVSSRLLFLDLCAAQDSPEKGAHNASKNNNGDRAAQAPLGISSLL